MQPIFLASELPSLGNVSDWVVTQGKYAITIIIVILLVKFIFRQELGRAIGIALLTGLTWFVISNSQTVFTAIGNIFKTIFGS
ncbi:MULTISPECIES: TcpD family membrane protein [Lactobacillaceae]|jgi:hypothetical protein|uniref:Uncharacterized protein n=2 Tax=Liquorilactobacillus TaxID=2767888 RepID=A0A3S6QP42_9LACO|nr:MULTISPECIES: TcpD family membrane protein [Lactobacillaceae]AUJ29792.1 hypothetical protein BSQ49_06060 [Liquorilactobacillus hordei]KRL37247.1 hypothetical protein FD20_GL000586 [Liquorilactobacillus uvarum DSM 19971]MCP9356719.1 hypothetical protein [Liquorilactobacillus satsumensis]MCP9370659.1 hypothetical protein [Liquorilactobacillus satsumensis]MDN2452228.1 hypothetical protein [Lactobacillus sp. UCMA15818]